MRKICQECAKPHVVSDQQRVWLQSVTHVSPEKMRLLRGKGCPHCHNTGYHGRTGVFEWLEMDRDMAEALRLNDVTAFVKAVRARSEFRPMPLAALSCAARGVTTLEEVMRVTTELESTRSVRTSSIQKQKRD